MIIRVDILSDFQLTGSPRGSCVGGSGELVDLVAAKAHIDGKEVPGLYQAPDSAFYMDNFR